MELETRYLVLKRKDINAAILTDEEKQQLEGIYSKINSVRIARGVGPLECVVVERDWPEYDETRQAIAKRTEVI